MKRLSSFSVTSTFTFILSVLAILVIAVSAPGMVQAVLGPAAIPASPADSAIQASDIKAPVVNPAAQIGTLADTGIFGTVGIGTTTPNSPLHIYSNTSTQPETIDLDGAQPITAQWNDYSNTGGAFSGSGFLGRFARGTKASPANVQVGDRLGFNVFGGWAGSWVHSAAIEALVDTGTVSASSLPTYIKFSTTPNGSTSRVERMRITRDGSVGIGTTTPINGFLDVETASNNGVWGSSGSSNTYAGVFGDNSGSGGFGVYGNNSSSGVGVRGASSSGDGVHGTSSGGTGVHGNSSSGFGVYGISDSSYGVKGQSNSLKGVVGTSNLGYGVYGQNLTSNNWGFIGDNNTGVYGNSVSGDAVYGGSSTGYAGYFQGKVYVNGTENVTGDLNITGTLRKGAGSFLIDHPSDPENKYLQHSFVESPDMKNIYDGTILLDEKGEATVELPSYFDALNHDFRYQLTAIGAPGPNLYISEEISGNHFNIAGGKAGMKVSWMVTGVRQDAYAKAHPIVVEQGKPANEQGLYLHPTEWGQPESKGIAQLHKPAGVPTLAKAE